jgi:hypothetical protein
MIVIVIASAELPGCCSAEEYSTAENTYPWWVTKEAIEGLHDEWENDIIKFPKGYWDDRKCVNKIEELKKVTFRYPCLVWYLQNLEDYEKGSEPLNYILFDYGYTFRIYLDEYWIGNITIKYREEEWKMTMMLIHQIKSDICGDPGAIIYNKYNNFSDSSRVVAGGLTSKFVIIENDRNITMLKYKLELNDFIEISTDEYLFEAHERYIQIEHEIPESYDLGDGRIATLPTMWKWSDFKKDILGKN